MSQSPSDKTSVTGYEVNSFSNTLKKFNGRYTDLVGQHKKNVSQIFVEFFNVKEIN